MIERNPETAAEADYDVLCIGGGAYGVALALEAARRGWRPLLLERDDFGGATSWNSLRIVHGGLRYLQSLDLPRFRESVGERRWFLRNFPDLVHPLACLMPLYGKGKRSPAVFRAAFRVDGFLGRRRNRGVREDRRLEAGRIVGVAETITRFPGVTREGLSGGALWDDAAMPDSQRILMEMLRWACRAGAVALNYVEAHELSRNGDRVTGVRAVDRETGETLEYRSPVVINCAGPWCRELAARFDRDLPDLFHPSIAFNLLLDRPPPSADALALVPRSDNAAAYFLHPWKGKIFAGTVHRTRDRVGGPDVTEDDIRGFLNDLNSCLPGSDLERRDVLRVHWGWVPAVREGSPHMSRRAIIHDHEAAGGPRGLFTISGVKFTTARLVAERTLGAVARRTGRKLPPVAGPDRPASGAPPDLEAFRKLVETKPDVAAATVKRLVAEESVVHLEDLMLRRTDWGIDPRVEMELGNAVRELLGWQPQPVEAHGSEA